jgi:hypothetical protein
VRKLFAGLLSVLAMTAGAAETSTWNLVEVQTKDKTVVGYIYHTAAVGTQLNNKKIEKVGAGLRLICSSKGNGESIITVYWDGMHGNTTQNVEVTVDKKQIAIGAPVRMNQDGPIIYRSLSESRFILQAMKTGQNIQFVWTGTDSINRTVIFNIQEFNSNYAAFASACRLES